MTPLTPALDVLALRRAFVAHGVTEFQTMAGWLPADRFDPYGMSPPDGEIPAGVNYGPHYTQYQGEIVRRDDGSLAVRDVPNGPVVAPFCLGLFPVR